MKEHQQVETGVSDEELVEQLTLCCVCGHGLLFIRNYSVPFIVTSKNPLKPTYVDGVFACITQDFSTKNPRGVSPKASSAVPSGVIKILFLHSVYTFCK